MENDQHEIEFSLLLSFSSWLDSGGWSLGWLDLHGLEFLDGHFWSLEDLNLGDVDGLDLEDVLALLFDALLDGHVDKELDELADGNLSDGLGDDLGHGVTKLALNRVLGVASLLVAVKALGEAHSEDTEDEGIRCLDLDGGVDEGTVLAEDGSKLVGGEAHTSKAGIDDILGSDGLPLEDTAVGTVLWSAVSMGDLEDTISKVVKWNLTTSWAVGDSNTHITLSEEAGDENMPPLLLQERILLNLHGGLAVALRSFTQIKKDGQRSHFFYHPTGILTLRR